MIDRKAAFFLAVTTFAVLFQHCSSKKENAEYKKIQEQAVQELRVVLQTQSEWVKVHAAEFLLWAGYPDGVSQAFKQEEQHKADTPQYRVGIWRVLAQAAADPDEKSHYVAKILEAFLDSAGSDRIHAAETLAKLEISPMNRKEALVNETVNSSNLPLALYTQWSIAYTSAEAKKNAQEKFLEVVRGNQATQRSIGAFALRRLGELPQKQWLILAETALEEPDSSAAAVYLLSAALVTAPGEVKVDDVQNQLLDYGLASTKNDRIEVCMALAEAGMDDHIPLLRSLLTNEAPLGIDSDDADVRAAAAYALLRIIERNS